MSTDAMKVVQRFLEQQGALRQHVVVSLSGAHAYGFPSQDSDFDLKAVHQDPTASLLGFPRELRSVERLDTVEGVEVDYSSNELGPVLQGVLKGNGNYIERFLSGHVLVASAALEEVKSLVKGALSRRVFRHYAGFATQQRLEWEKTDRRSAKKLLYVLRTTLTGAHLLSTGEVVTRLDELLAPYAFDAAHELIEHKKRQETIHLPDPWIERWTNEVPRAFAVLDQALAQSPLPEEPVNADALEAWLVQRRLITLGA